MIRIVRGMRRALKPDHCIVTHREQQNVRPAGAPDRPWNSSRRLISIILNLINFSDN
jgi:hypothetical protein